MIFKSSIVGSLSLLAAVSLMVTSSEGRTIKVTAREDEESAVIPSPNYAIQGDQESLDIERTGPSQRRPDSQQVAAASELSSVPVYVSPFARAERAGNQALNFEHQESSHAPPNYAPRPAALMPAASTSGAAPSSADLKTSASYGHHQHGGHHGYEHGGWLDMGAWTGGKGSFGWYADYPVGGKHGYGYGKRR